MGRTRDQLAAQEWRRSIGEWRGRGLTVRAFGAPRGHRSSTKGSGAFLQRRRRNWRRCGVPWCGANPSTSRTGSRKQPRAWDYKRRCVRPATKSPKPRARNGESTPDRFSGPAVLSRVSCPIRFAPRGPDVMIHERKRAVHAGLQCGLGATASCPPRC